LFCDLSKCILLFSYISSVLLLFSYISSVLLLFLLHLLHKLITYLKVIKARGIDGVPNESLCTFQETSYSFI
jgi:hypothetical protein